MRDASFLFSRKNPQLFDSVLENTPGVVLIDELDMHLHPSWQARIMDEYNEKMMGKTLRVLVEGFDRYSECYFGRSFADSPDIDGKVFFHGKKGIVPGSFVDVVIDGELDGDLLGEVK